MAGTFNQSLQCTQDVFVGFQAPSPPVEVEAQTGLKIRFFRSDRGGKFMGKEFDTFLADKGIIRETSAPDTPQQNGLAERMNQTIWSGV